MINTPGYRKMTEFSHIIALPLVDGEPDYLAWITKETEK